MLKRALYRFGKEREKDYRLMFNVHITVPERLECRGTTIKALYRPKSTSFTSFPLLEVYEDNVRFNVTAGAEQHLVTILRKNILDVACFLA